MRRSLIIAFLMFPLPLLATPVDSTFGPFKLPFHIGVTVYGRFRWTAGSYFPGPPDKFGHAFTVDSLGTRAHAYPIDSVGTYGVDTTQVLVVGDTLRYRFWSKYTSQGHQELVYSGESYGFDLLYDGAHSAIPWIRFSGGSYYNAQYSRNNDYTGWSANLAQFKYDRDSIYATDTMMKNHLDTAMYAENGQSGDLTTLYWISLDTVKAVDLSGAFATAHFGEASVAPQEIAANFFVHVEHGILSCSFSAAPRPRLIEIYSSIGALVSKAEVQPGSESVALGHISAGLYFLHMGGLVKKIYLAQ